MFRGSTAIRASTIPFVHHYIGILAAACSEVQACGVRRRAETKKGTTVPFFTSLTAGRYRGSAECGGAYTFWSPGSRPM